MAEIVEKKSRTKIIIVLLVVIIVLMALLGVFLIAGLEVSDITELFHKDEEYTLLLDEFVVNLKPEDGGKNFLKTTIALMYTEKDYDKDLVNNSSKLRDIIISVLREKTVSDLSDDASIDTLKNEIIAGVNSVLGEDVVKDVYINDIVIQ